MKIGIMQPYYFPYIGYWQLLNAVDIYVIYDDVNYIKGGWINRNKILINGQPKYINLQLSKASPNRLINEINVLGDKVYNNKLLKTIQASYKKAPNYPNVITLIREIINQDEVSLAQYLVKSIKKINKYIGIKTPLILSSNLGKNDTLRGQAKIIEICKQLNAKVYINAIGGQGLYSELDFKEKGIQIKFLKTKEIRYLQFNNDFVPNLSIIDVMMFNSAETINQMLREYVLL